MPRKERNILCPHYCSVGGHIWEHEVKPHPTLSTCDHKIHDDKMRVAVVKFFVVCPLHDNKATRL